MSNNCCQSPTSYFTTSRVCSAITVLKSDLRCLRLDHIHRHSELDFNRSSRSVQGIYGQHGCDIFQRRGTPPETLLSIFVVVFAALCPAKASGETKQKGRTEDLAAGALSRTPSGFSPASEKKTDLIAERCNGYNSFALLHSPPTDPARSHRQLPTAVRHVGPSQPALRAAWLSRGNVALCHLQLESLRAFRFTCWLQVAISLGSDDFSRFKISRVQVQKKHSIGKPRLHGLAYQRRFSGTGYPRILERWTFSMGSDVGCSMKERGQIRHAKRLLVQVKKNLESKR